VSLASDIITAAYREPEIVAKVTAPDTIEVAEGLALLNNLVLSVVGNEVGKELHDIAVGGAYDQSQFVSSWIPENARLVLNLGSARSVSAHPRPYDGQRMAIADAGNNLATRNLTLSGNGRLIEGATSVTLNVNGTARQWMYRADTGNWVRISSLAAGDEMPFPQEFDDYFQVRLALRLVSRHSTSLAPESQLALRRAETQLRARYRRPRGQQDMGTLGLLNSNRYGFGGCSDLLR
jgi:hypothetical protein